MTEVGEFVKLKSASFFGFAGSVPGDELYESAKDVAREVAKAGLTIVNGGGPGVMRASTEGAHEGGGKAVVATFYPKYMGNFEGKDVLNRADKEYVLDNYLERTLKLLELGNIYVVFNGGTGTISEFGMAWGLAQLYLGNHKPLILYGDFWHAVVESMVNNMKVKEDALKVYSIATTPQGVVEDMWRFEEMLVNSGEDKKQVYANGDSELAFMN